MKLKEVEFVVMSDEEYGKHLNLMFEKVKRGEIDEQEPHRIFVRNAEIIGKTLTSERIRLIQVIKEKKPESISELARILRRKQSNVYMDVIYLEGLGLIELKKGRNRVKKAPVIEYDAVHVTIPLIA